MVKSSRRQPVKLQYYVQLVTIVQNNGITLRYQPPFRTVRAQIAVALVVFIKTPINHIFFKSLIIPDYGFELTKTIYLNVFRNWNALCKSTRLYKSCSTPAENKRKKTINTAFASQHVPLKNREQFNCTLLHHEKHGLILSPSIFFV